LKKVDIVLSHNSPFKIHDYDDIAHYGFMPLKNYIKKHNPKYCIHGHQYINKETNFLETKVIGICGASILDVDSGNLERIFLLDRQAVHTRD